MLAVQRPPFYRPAGTREALPGTIAGLAPRVLRLNLEKRVEDYAEIQRKDLKPVGQHLRNRADVGLAYKRQLLELAHAALLFCAGEMALAGVHANDFAGRCNLETLGGAAMRFQFLLWLSRISRHYKILSEQQQNSFYFLLAWGAAVLRPYCESKTLRRLRGLLRTWLGHWRAFFGREQCDENVAFHARHRFDLAVLADFPQQTRHFGAAHFLVRHLAATMENHGAHFMAFSEEADDLVLANLIIVLRSGRSKLYFLELGAAAALALLMRLFILLVKKFAVVGDLANRRVGGGRNFHQVESPFARHTNRFVRLHHSKLGTLLIYHPDFARPNPLIHASAVALPEATFCDNSP